MVRGSNSAVADKQLAATERINLFFRIVNLYLHILITYEGMFIGVLGQVAFIFYEDIVESFESKKTITAFCTLARFQIPLKKLYHNLCTHSRVTQKMLIFFYAAKIMENR